MNKNSHDIEVNIIHLANLIVEAMRDEEMTLEQFDKAKDIVEEVFRTHAVMK